MSVLGKGIQCRNKIAAVHRIKCYCVPVLTFACEIWQLSSAEYHNVGVLWNNSFRRIFNSCWRESTIGLQFHCGCQLPSNAMFNRATDYIVLSAYIKRL